MFEHKNKKEIEFKKTRSASRRREGVQIMKSAYKIFYYFLLLSFFVILAYCLFFSPFLLVTKVEVDGLESLNKQKVLEVASRAYGGKYLGLIPRNNFIVFPSGRASEDLKREFRRIKKVSISKEFPNAVRIRIEERQSLLLWCTPAQECFVMDENGFAYSKVALDSKEAMENNLVKIYSGEENRAIFEGEKVLDSDKVSTLLDARDKFRSTGTTGDIYIKSRMAEEFSLKSSEGWDILLNTNFSLDEAKDTLDVFLQKELRNPEDRKNLEYVDLRVESRAYYKTKDGEENRVEEEGDGKKEPEKAEVDMGGGVPA